MAARSACALAFVLAAGVTGCAPHHLSADQFRATYAPADYAIVANARPATPANARLSEHDMIDDLAYLERMLGHAWAYESTATSATVADRIEREQQLPTHAHTPATFCSALAEIHYHQLDITLAGARCPTGYDRGDAMPHASAFEPPADTGARAYAWAIDRDRASAVGVLTIRHFTSTPATDPAAWDGFGDALRELADQEDVVIDVQAADGDDPRVALAILATLGLSQPHWYRAPVAHDDDFAQIARRNHADMQPARSRTLWFSLATLPDLARAAAEIGVPTRTRPLAHAMIVVGPGCGVACQLFGKLAWDQHGAAIVGPAVVDRIAGDERGAIRLPHSGIEVVFPTVAYGPYSLGAIGDPPGSGWQSRAQVIAELHRKGNARAEAVAWDSRPPVDCAALPTTHDGLDHKRSGCMEAGGSFGLRVLASPTVATRFLATCPGVKMGSVIGPIEDGGVIVTIGADEPALARVANAPFVTSVEGECPVYPNAR